VFSCDLNFMKKIQIILLVLIIIGLGLIFTQKFWVDWLVNFILESKGEVVEVNDPLNLTYKIAGQDYQLVNGKIEKEIAPGSASKEVVMVFGEPVYVDLDKDGDQDGNEANDNGIDAVGGTLTTELTAVVRNPPANAVIFGLTAGAAG
jgi:hypothetical protein